MPDHIAEQHTEQGSQLFEALFQNASLGILVINKEGKIALVNNFLVSLFHYSDVSELIGKEVEILIPARFHKHHVGDRQRYTKKPERRPMGIGRDLFGKKKEGDEFPVEISLSGYKTGEDVYVIAFVMRKHAEADGLFLAHLDYNLHAVGILETLLQNPDKVERIFIALAKRYVDRRTFTLQKRAKTFACFDTRGFISLCIDNGRSDHR